MHTATQTRVASATTTYIRPEIQGLRALAVTGVLLYHLWPHRLAGGFVGVDVFFVVSGFLITSHLISEVKRTGTINAAEFWARRVRRLLPASLIVLFVTLIAIIAWVPRSLWRQFLEEVVAATLYVENWSLARGAVDYFAQAQFPSPTQHFWSLSVEEQFYFVWPLLILGALWVHRRQRMSTSTNPGIVLVGFVVAVSFVASLALSASDPAVAYIATQSRAWEFGAGALLSYVTVARGAPWLRVAAAWSGIAAIVVSFAIITPASAFPAPAGLLPVAGTLLVLWAGNPHARFSPASLWAWRPVRWVGDASYSIYLWHWPLIVLVPFVAQDRLDALDKVLIGIATLILATLQWRFVERAFKGDSPLAKRKPLLTFGLALAAMAVIIGIATLYLQQVYRDEASAREYSTEVIERADDCLGAAAIDSVGPAGCDAEPAPEAYIPAPTLLLADRENLAAEGCDPGAGHKPIESICDFRRDGDGLRVALVGDSHAMHWFPAVYDIAKAQGWYLHVSTQFACPWNSVVTAGTDRADRCAQWNQAASEHFAANDPYDLVIATHRIRGDDPEIYGESTATEVLAGFTERIRGQADRGTTVVVLKDTPRYDDETLACLATHPNSPLDCEVPMSEAFPYPDPMAEAATQVAGAHVIDMTQYFCENGECPTAIGSVMVLRDGQHLTATYSRTLTQYLWEQLEPLVEGSKSTSPQEPGS